MRRRGICLVPCAVLAASVAYGLWYRQRMNRWGATDEEVAKALPGDAVEPAMPPIVAELTRGRRISTRAITIDAPPEEVWPWLVQMGHGRAGFYSHDWLERLLGIRYADGRSATRIHPEFQDLEVGGTVAYHPFAAMPVVALDRPRYFHAGERIVLEPLNVGRATRVLTRTAGGWLEPLARRVPVAGPALVPIAAILERGPGELLHHYMGTGMLPETRRPTSAGTTRSSPGRSPSPTCQSSRTTTPASPSWSAKRPPTDRRCSPGSALAAPSRVGWQVSSSPQQSSWIRT